MHVNPRSEKVVQIFQLLIQLCETLSKVEELIVGEANHEGFVVG